MVLWKIASTDAESHIRINIAGVIYFRLIILDLGLIWNGIDIFALGN